MGHVRGVEGSRIVAIPVASSARAAAISEVDFAIHVKATIAKRSAARVGLGVACGARSRVVVLRWRSVAVAAGHRGLGVGPARLRTRTTARVARAGAARIGRGERWARPCRRRDEAHVDDAGRVSASRAPVVGDGMARGAGHARRARRPRFDMRGVRS